MRGVTGMDSRWAARAVPAAARDQPTWMVGDTVTDRSPQIIMDRARSAGATRRKTTKETLVNRAPQMFSNRSSLAKHDQPAVRVACGVV